LFTISVFVLQDVFELMVIDGLFLIKYSDLLNLNTKNITHSRQKPAVEFEDAWLEVRVCAGGQTAGANKSMLAVPAISEVLETAANTNKHAGIWDYSQRLGAEEVEQVRRAIRFTDSAEDSRSISLSANVTYRGSRYTLTLFAIKRSQ
jgi:hypothetical protein